MKILVPNSFPLTLDTDDEQVVYDIKADIPDEHRDAEVLVVWGNKPAKLKEIASQLPKLKLVQTLMAGTDAILAAGFNDDAVLCGGAGLHDRTVTEHTVALTLALVRKVPTLVANKATHTWTWEISGRQELATKPVTTLIGANVLIWGFGSIAQRLAPVLDALGANVVGAARSAGERGGFPVVDEAHLDDELARADVLIMILPDTEHTTNALNAERLAKLPEHAYVVNVGRGRTVDEDALVQALEDGSIAGAAIDVMWREPLPEDSPLWEAPNLLISPHAAGGRPIGADELVTHQLRALATGGEFRNLVAR